MATGDFLGGFADAFSRIYFPAMQEQKTRKENEEFKKLQLKKIKTDLDLQEQQANARGTVLDRLSDQRGPPMSLTDMLSGSPGLLLQSGLVDTKDLLQEQRLRSGQDIFKQLSQQFLGNGNAGGTGLEGPSTPQPDIFSLMAATQSGDLGKLRPSELDKPLSPTELLNIPGAKPGMTMRDVMNAGLNPQKESELKIEQKMRSARQISSDLQQVVDRVFVNDDFTQRLAQGFALAPEKISRENPDIVYLLDFESKLAPLVKSLGEAGALANEDIERAMKLVPRVYPIPDSKKVAQTKMRELTGLINAAVNKIEPDSAFTSDDQKRLEELEKQLGGP